MNITQHIKLTDQGFAFNTATGDSYMMNETAQTILRGLRAGRTEHEIIHALVLDYGRPEREMERDVTDFCSRLRSVGLENTPTN